MITKVQLTYPDRFLFRFSNLIFQEVHVRRSFLTFFWIDLHFLLNVSLGCLRDLYEINAYRADHVCLSVRIIQIENRWTELDEIKYGCYAIGSYPKILLSNFL